MGTGLSRNGLTENDLSCSVDCGLSVVLRSVDCGLSVVLRSVDCGLSVVLSKIYDPDVVEVVRELDVTLVSMTTSLPTFCSLSRMLLFAADPDVVEVVGKLEVTLVFAFCFSWLSLYRSRSWVEDLRML